MIETIFFITNSSTVPIQYYFVVKKKKDLFDNQVISLHPELVNSAHGKECSFSKLVGQPEQWRAT